MQLDVIAGLDATPGLLDVIPGLLDVIPGLTRDPRCGGSRAAWIAGRARNDIHKSALMVEHAP